jgi:glycyl-tRNA synthetase beta chain
MTHTLLLEIGVEELPASFVAQALAALPELVSRQLTEHRLGSSRIHVSGTPRRLAVFVEGVASRQTDLDEEVVGPPEAAAYKDGKPTRAAESFAEKLGLTVDKLKVVAKEASGRQKAGRFVVAQRVETGRGAGEVLPGLLANLCSNIPFRKSMRWGSLDTTFGRPVQWLVALLDAEVLPVSFAGLVAGRRSRGHRFLAPDWFEIPKARDYRDLLRARHVLVDTDERRNLMLERVKQAAASLGGIPDAADILVSENLTLVEEPFVVSGTFAESFLELPSPVIRAVARGHQRYFCVEKGEGALAPSYVAVVNTAENPANIQKGMNRVMTARLSDARFFFEEDKKASIDSRMGRLAGIVFHHRLGTVLDKVARLENLSAAIAKLLPSTDANMMQDARESARLAKFDLASLMVGEFPELQGHMGECYARLQGVSANVSAAIREHYEPVSADGDLPASRLGRIVALADRLDTLVGCFAVGLEPSGSADPFALRRNCIAILRLLLGSHEGDTMLAGLSLQALIRASYNEHQAQLVADPKRRLDLDAEAAVQKLGVFFEERLRGLLTHATASDVADFVLSATPRGFVHADAPTRALGHARATMACRNEAWIDSAKTVSKRLSGIAKDTAPKLAEALNPSKPDDARVVAMVRELDGATASLSTEQEVVAALRVTASVAPELDQIFARSLMADPEDSHTPARLATLAFGAACMLRLGDFQKVQRPQTN